MKNKSISALVLAIIALLSLSCQKEEANKNYFSIDGKNYPIRTAAYYYSEVSKGYNFVFAEDADVVFQANYPLQSGVRIFEVDIPAEFNGQLMDSKNLDTFKTGSWKFYAGFFDGKDQMSFWNDLPEGTCKFSYADGHLSLDMSLTFDMKPDGDAENTKAKVVAKYNGPIIPVNYYIWCPD